VFSAQTEFDRRLKFSWQFQLAMRGYLSDEFARRIAGWRVGMKKKPPTPLASSGAEAFLKGAFTGCL
jgi:hypothetical protein